MRALETAHDIFSKFAHFIARRRPAFECGDCERAEQCGLPPSDTCVVMAAQLERYDGRLPRHSILRQW